MDYHPTMDNPQRAVVCRLPQHQVHDQSEENQPAGNRSLPGKLALLRSKQ